MQQATSPTEQKNLRYLFVLLSAIILILMPVLSKDYGQSGDEWVQIEYGQHIYNYFFHGNRQALDYNNMPLQYQGLEFYGGLFEYAMAIMHSWFPSIPILHLRHFFIALFGAVLMIFTGLFTYRISNRNWMAGTIALLLIIFSPRIFGESMNNSKDIPFATGFIVGVYFFLAILQDVDKRIWRNTIGVAIGFAITFGIRPAGGLLLIANFFVMIGMYYMFHKSFQQKIRDHNGRLLKRIALMCSGAILIGYIIGLFAWPWGLQDPLLRPLEALKQMTNLRINIRVFFEGAFRPNNSMPWYYEFKWICMSNPIIVIAGFALFFVLMRQCVKRYGMFATLFVLFAALFTPLYMIYKKSSVYDTWRHVFFIYPFWVTMAALSISLFSDFFKNEKLKWLPLGIAVIGLLPAIVWTVKTHPNQYVYFNELVGGIKGAEGYYDTDYYQNSGLQNAKWILKNVKPIPGKKIIVASNMVGFDKYFAKDTSWLVAAYARFNERHTKDWDYYVTYSRYISPQVLQNEKWPPANVVHEVKVEGVTISAVIERKSKAGIAANDSLQAKNYADAARLYAEYMQADASDEYALINYGIALASIGSMDEAIEAIKKAISIDSGNPQFYQILAQLYGAKGDNANAQQATNQANALIMQEQEMMAGDD